MYNYSLDSTSLFIAIILWTFVFKKRIIFMTYMSKINGKAT